MRLDYFFYGYGVLTLLGGAMGYVVAGSQTSLIAGMLSGLILLLGAYLRSRFPGVSFLALALTSALLLAKFGVDFANKGTFMPAGLMTIFSVLALVLLLLKVLRPNTRA